MNEKTKNQVKVHSLKSATDKTLGIKDGVARIHGGLVLGSITNQAFLIRESNI